MEDFRKIGLLILNEDSTKFMVCQKHPKENVSQYILPGGQIEIENEIECIEREIMEELNCKVNKESLEFIGEYRDLAAGHKDKYVNIKLYKGKIIGNAVPSSEIMALHWISKHDAANNNVSKIIKEKIIPDLIKRNILK